MTNTNKEYENLRDYGHTYFDIKSENLDYFDIIENDMSYFNSNNNNNNANTNIKDKNKAKKISINYINSNNSINNSLTTIEEFKNKFIFLKDNIDFTNINNIIYCNNYIILQYKKINKACTMLKNDIDYIVNIF